MTGPATGERRRFQVNLAALIQILSRHLYSEGPQVVIRELLQNAVDAITARRQFDPQVRGRIELEMVLLSDGCWQLIVTDNGIGVHPDEVESCFATICDSLKRGEEWAENDTPYLGRFGVGQLSCFVVAGEVTIISRKVTSPGEPEAQAFRWTGWADGTWEMEPAPEVLLTGTRVFLKLPRDWTPETVLRAAQRYGRYLPGPIFFRAPGLEEPVTETPPWDRDLPETALLAAGHELFGGGEEFAGAFAFNDDATRTRGIALIVREPAPCGLQPMHRLYVRGMLVGEKVCGLNPEYASFLRIVCDSQRLRVNVARENLHGEEKKLEQVRAAVDVELIRWLEVLGKREPQRLQGIVFSQHEAMLAGVEQGHTELLRDLTRAIPLTTSLGCLTYEQILRRHGRVEYIETEKDWHRVEPKAKQEGHCLVRADYRTTYQLLAALRRHWRNAPPVALTAAEYFVRFGTVAPCYGLEEQRLMRLAETELRVEQCSLAFRDGEEPYELAQIEFEDEESILRQLRTGDGEDGGPGAMGKTLRLNRVHPFVAQLLSSPDSPDDQLSAWLRLIYHHALLSAREIATAGENRRHTRALSLLLGATGGPL
jgi:molecular chaperone HtpG